MQGHHQRVGLGGIEIRRYPGKKRLTRPVGGTVVGRIELVALLGQIVPPVVYRRHHVHRLTQPRHELVIEATSIGGSCFEQFQRPGEQTSVATNQIRGVGHVVPRSINTETLTKLAPAFPQLAHSLQPTCERQVQRTDILPIHPYNNLIISPFTGRTRQRHARPGVPVVSAGKLPLRQRAFPFSHANSFPRVLAPCNKLNAHLLRRDVVIRPYAPQHGTARMGG